MRACFDGLLHDSVFSQLTPFLRSHSLIQRLYFTTAVPKSMMVKSDSREDILHEDASLATTFIKTLFCVLYEVYSSSVSLYKYNSYLFSLFLRHNSSLLKKNTIELF